MTKIFAINSDAKEGDEKKEMEGIKISSTTPQATLYPVTLPISSTVAKKRFEISCIMIMLLYLMTFALLLYAIPGFFYNRADHLVSSKVTISGSSSPWTQRSGRFDVAEENTNMLPKTDSLVVPEKMNRMDQNGEMIQDNDDNRIALNQDGGNVATDDQEMKQPNVVPNRFETMKAIATLMKIPGVQQVAVVQNNGRMSGDMMMKPKIMRAVPFGPVMEMREWDLMNYRRALREWLLRREMFRRRMLAELERERERRISQFIMDLQLRQQQNPIQLERVPIFAVGQVQIAPALPPVVAVNNMQSPMDANQRNIPIISMLPPIVVAPRIPPMYPFMINKQQEREAQQQQPQPAIVPIKFMPPQVMNSEVPVVQNIESIQGKLNIAPLLIRDDTININGIDMEQRKIPVPTLIVDQPIPLTPDGTPDRDTIFKELRSRAQMQQQMSQTILPVAIMPPSVPSVVSPAQANSDAIFRELQNQALRMQIMQDRMEAEQRPEKEKNADGEVPVIMIADTFPKRPVEAATGQTSDEVTEATNADNFEATTKASNSASSSESLSTFFNFFEKGFSENEITNAPENEQEITIKNDNVKAESERSDEDTVADILTVRNDKFGMVVKPDEIAPQTNFVQEPESTQTPATMNISGERIPKIFKSEGFSGQSDDDNNVIDVLNAPENIKTP